VTNATGLKPGRDVLERYPVLRKELDQRMAELDRILKIETVAKNGLSLASPLFA
jgi:hypothetical protein